MRNVKKLMAMGLAVTMVSAMLIGCGSTASTTDSPSKEEGAAEVTEETEEVEANAETEAVEETLEVPEVAEATLKGDAVAAAAKSASIEMNVDMNNATADLTMIYVMDVGTDMEFVIAQSEIPEDADAMKYTSCVELGKGTITGSDGNYEVTFNYTYNVTDEDGNVTDTMDMTTTIPMTYADGVYTATIEASADGTGASGILGACIDEDCTITSAE